MPQLVQKPGKSIACHRCHVRKVKCSGGQPCAACRDGGQNVECVYPNRDRQIKLSQRYVETLLEEIERLRNNTAGTPTSPLPTVQTGERLKETSEHDEGMQNPLFKERPWFHAVSSLDMPIHIGEAADTAFSTRFRQTYVPDLLASSIQESKFRWPSPARARFLLKVALTSICRYYHIVRKSVVEESLEAAIKNNGLGERLVIGKLLALFALGEAYSAKTAVHVQGTAFPGSPYFEQVTRMVCFPTERPHMNIIEISLLLSLYSFTVNRRHSAYLFASSAARIGLIMGMHLNMPESQCRDPLVIEHRVRLWWSIYIIDRTCASKLGLPVTIADDDILVSLPSRDGCDSTDCNDFGDLEYELCSIALSKIAAKSTKEIYSRTHRREPFSQRVQSILKELSTWLEQLPSNLRLKNDGSSSSDRAHIVYLHLSFNQGIILATRPILLHVLDCHRNTLADPDVGPSDRVSENALTLAETCIQCARHSYRIITDAWIHGTFATFDYFNTQYLFVAATVLAISSLLGNQQNDGDKHNFDNAVELLQQLDRSGSFGAKEFCEHIDAMQQSMAAVHESDLVLSLPQITPNTNEGTLESLGGNGLTASMALAEPSFQDFLADTDLVIQGFDNPSIDNPNTLYWPELWGEGWASADCS
ncbi:fungal-specific transcription factor domain-containing protein [Aaosphaeria arxii CBS 175.79]|uniref:Fungal-specific transcription factor domain-containing protein n=1 Tax=Aaosphaeria arxii CBS 175.79 TaxID=1450172 RepID=A0A6A5XMP6_9PLEO|nr:fungal-specific transcription factor domain-containing protein [Aaosphaeria arxii CBS 175.79]KAF2014081.1 fungal-specific transcription factor domain-containing protein [Aaosphaeria arxii CBS 175.79]